jgi:ELWxxDGT repeat protein
MKAKSLLAALALLLPLPAAGLPEAAAGEPAHLVADLDPGLAPFDPFSGADFSSYVTVGGRVVFFGFLPEGNGFLTGTQCGLWTVDPASGAAERLAALCSNVENFEGSRLRWLTPSGGGPLAYFSDFTGRLWRTDGTAAGSFVLGTVTVGGSDEFPVPPALGADGRTLVFQGCAAATGCEPWRSDGTPRGTRPLRDLAPGPGSSFPYDFIRDGARVLFTAGFGALWSTDGTGPGTVRLAQVSASPLRVLPHGGLIYLLNFGRSAAVDLFVYDPLTARTRKLHSFFLSDDFGRVGATFEEVAGRLLIRQLDNLEGSNSLWEVKGKSLVPLGPPFVFTALSPLQEAGGRIVFAASRTSAPPTLWTLAPGMQRPRPLTGCPGGCPAIDTDLAPAAEVAGRLYFPGRDAAHGRELWSTDGTAAGTRLEKDLCPGACDGGPAQLRPALGRLVLTDRQGGLWASDGTVGGTVRLADTGDSVLHPAFGKVVDLTAAQGRIVFTGLDPAAGLQPFVSDLTPAGTALLARIGSGLAAGSSPTDLSPLGASVLFQACAADADFLWMSDGTAAGTSAIPGSAKPCPIGRPPVVLERVGSLAVFDWEGKVWRTDGTAAGTFPVLTLPAGLPVRGWTASGGKLLFMLDPPAFPPTDDGLDWTVWTSDGTPEGTAAAFTLRFRSQPASFAAGGEGEFLFTAPPAASRDGSDALWRTDGTAAGTRILLPSTGSALETARLGGTTYVLIGAIGVGSGLWTTDGTAAGTRLILPIPGDPYELTVFDGALYFFAGGYPLNGGPEQPPQALWRSDGTPAGTRIVKTIDPPHESEVVGGLLLPELTVAGGHLFFRADDGVHGAELWATDGTPEGTVMVKDVHPGPASSFPGSLAAAGGRLYFAATDGEHGVEFWQSDGTAEGTVMVQDIVPGPAPSNPEQLTGADGLLYFTADDGVHGREPWVLPLPR